MNRTKDRQFPHYHADPSDIIRLPKIRTPGTAYRHRIAKVTVRNRIFYLHATKGWRSERGVAIIVPPVVAPKPTSLRRI